MIPVKEIYDVIRTQGEVCFLRVQDINGNKLFDFSGANTQDVVSQLESNEKQIKHYGKVIVRGATKGQHQAGYKGANWWIVKYDEQAAQTATGATVAAADPFAQMVSMMSAMKMLNEMNGNEHNKIGYVHPEVAAAKIALATKEKELEFEKYKIQMNADDPIKKYGALAPMVLSAMGKSPEEITKLINMSAMMHQAQNGMNKAAGVVLSTDNVTGEFKNLQTVTPEEKNTRIEKALTELAGKISAEEMLILVESLNKKPEFATQAVIMLQGAMPTDENKAN